ncbi:MAG: class I SAM-dependent methyltransferase [Pseudomonadota bacterium]
MARNRIDKLGPGRQKQLTGWFQTHLGRLLAERECRCLENRVASLFGYYLVQIGSLHPELDLLGASPVKNKIVLDSRAQASNLLADPLQLPLATDSIDGVVMHHALDFSPDPHQVLREVERVLIPEGKLILIGFNPWSLWGCWRLFHPRSAKPPWIGHFFTLKRVTDWLALLGFDLRGVDYLSFRPPLQNQAIMQKLVFLEGLGERGWPMLGGVYVLEAVKRTLTMTPIRPKWRIGKKVLPATVEPTTRNL